MELRAVLIDDEAQSREILRAYLGKYCENVEVLGEGANIEAGLELIRSKKPDLVFLDVEMPFGNAFDLLEQLPERSFETVFVTAYQQYAMDALNSHAAYYLMKPISFSRFLKAVNKANTGGKSMESSSTDQIANQEKVISVKSGTIIHRINLNDLLYLEADGNYTKFVTDKESIMVLCTMKDALSKVDERFIQTHRSYAVSTSKVNKVEAHQLRIGDKTIPIGSSYRKEVLEKFSN